MSYNSDQELAKENRQGNVPHSYKESSCEKHYQNSTSIYLFIIRKQNSRVGSLEKEYHKQSLVTAWILNCLNFMYTVNNFAGTIGSKLGLRI